MVRETERLKKTKRVIYTAGEGIKLWGPGKTQICQLPSRFHTFLMSSSSLTNYSLIFMGPHSSLLPSFFSSNPHRIDQGRELHPLLWNKGETIVLSIKARISCFTSSFCCLVQWDLVSGPTGLQIQRSLIDWEWRLNHSWKTYVCFTLKSRWLYVLLI